MDPRVRFFTRAVMGSLCALPLLNMTSCTTKQGTLPPELGDESGPPPHPPISGGGSGGDGGGALDGNTEGGQCNRQPNGASVVNENDVGEALPPAIGGAIATGTYWLTAVNFYTGVGGNSGPTGRQFQETINYADTTFTDVLAEGAVDGGLGAPVWTSGSWSTAGAQLSLTPTCPAGGTATYSYSVTGSNLHILISQDEFIYTLQ